MSSNKKGGTTGGVAGVLVGAFMLGGFFLLSGEPEESPYNTTTYDEVTPVHNVQGGVGIEQVSDLKFAQSLPMGVHIIHDKANDEFNVVMKFRHEALDRGYGFFAMDSISEDYVPNTAPTSNTENMSLWTVASANDIVNDDLMPGKYIYTISGDRLNGQDLKLSVVYDVDQSFDEGFGYMGLNVIEPAKQSTRYSYDYAPN